MEGPARVTSPPSMAGRSVGVANDERRVITSSCGFVHVGQAPQEAIPFRLVFRLGDMLVYADHPPRRLDLGWHSLEVERPAAHSFCPLGLEDIRRARRPNPAASLRRP